MPSGAAHIFCANCGGRLRLDTNGRGPRPCPECDGTGTIETVHGSLIGNPPEHDEVRCDRCLGTGIVTVFHNHDPQPRPFADLSSDVTGLLWLINRVCFHPRGYALALHREDDGSISGWSMQGDGTEVWTFSNESDDECFAKVTAYFAAPPNGSGQSS